MTSLLFKCLRHCQNAYAWLSKFLTMSGVILEQVNEVLDIIQVVDCCHAEALGVSDCCAEEQAPDSSEAVDSYLH